MWPPTEAAEGTRARHPPLPLSSRSTTALRLVHVPISEGAQPSHPRRGPAHRLSARRPRRTPARPFQYMIQETLPYLEPIGMAVVFSILWYARSEDTDTLSTDDWRWDKFLATFAVGLSITFGMLAAGVDLTFLEFKVRMSAYTGTIVLIQGAIQALYRNVTNQ